MKGKSFSFPRVNIRVILLLTGKYGIKQGKFMGILRKIFSTIKKEGKEEQTGPKNELCAEIEKFQRETDELLIHDAYIARSDFQPVMDAFDLTGNQLTVMEENQVLGDFCRKNGMEEKGVCRVLSLWKSWEKTVEEHNDNYVSETMRQEADYLDHILDEVDPNIRLDEDQRRVVLTDEDYCLVIAGAGAGKTTTVAAKVKYLTEKKGVDPKEILVVSFTNKAVEELKEKINRDLKIDCPITTFHAAGNAILRRQSSEPLQVADPGKLYYVILDFFRNSVLQDESLVSNLILFFGSYFDAPYEGKDLESFFRKVSRTNHSTLRSDLNEISQTILDRKTGRKVTISNEVLRSMEEVEIANFLYLNQIDYEYEPVYQYRIPYARKPYTPDFLLTQNGKRVYLEHFGITEDGKNDRYSQDQLMVYLQAIEEKIQFHKKHGTRLIYTYSQYKDGRPLREHLAELLSNEGFVLKPRPAREVMEKLISSEENRYIRKLIQLICRFITNFKVNGYGADEFSRMYHSTSNERSRLFLNICNSCYLEYQRVLKENNLVDFEDMINESARILREKKEQKEKLDFKYIIVDEYQDISRQRFDLTTALAEVCDAKSIAVGDDWQSIYAFSGADVKLFTHFAEKMGYGKLLKIVKTYRNSQEVIDIAGGFIQRNPAQIQKTLQSPKHIENPVVIYTYDGSRKKAEESNHTGALYRMARGVETALEQIRKYAAQESDGKSGNVLLLGRFGFDGDHLERSGLFEYVQKGSRIRWVRHPEMDITFMTAHASKGLGYDNVIVINGKNETYGFPAKVEDDPVLAFVIKGDRSIDYAEERRLFYVAMTRTKNRVYFVAPEQNPSEFLLEIKRDYKNVSLVGSWNEEVPVNAGLKKNCPVCGYPLQLRYRKSYGLRLYICTNEPEICGFLSNDLRGGKMSILKCNQCADGYMIIKGKRNDRDQVFLGCTNYEEDGTGCNNMMSRRMYYARFHLTEEAETEEPPRRKKSEEASQQLEIRQSEVQQTEKARFRTESRPQWGDQVSDEIQDNSQEETVTAIHHILDCVENVSRFKFFGITVTLDILKGEDTSKIRKYQLFQIPQFGALKDMDRKKLWILIDWMIENEYLLQTKGQYPVLHPTYNGRHFSETVTEKQMEELRKKMKV